MGFHLVQVNVAVPKFSLRSEEMQGFTSRLGEVNRVAESAEGFIWRLIEDGTEAPSGVVFGHSEMLVNLSVWRSVEALIEFSYKGAHREVFGGREQWFERSTQPNYALWWVPEWHTPTLAEANSKLDHLRQHGPTAVAFTFANRFAPGGYGEMSEGIGT